jgi:hypothetical protein
VNIYQLKIYTGTDGDKMSKCDDGQKGTYLACRKNLHYLAKENEAFVNVRSYGGVMTPGEEMARQWHEEREPKVLERVREACGQESGAEKLKALQNTCETKTRQKMEKNAKMREQMTMEGWVFSRD